MPFANEEEEEEENAGILDEGLDDVAPLPMAVAEEEVFAERVDLNEAVGLSRAGDPVLAVRVKEAVEYDGDDDAVLPADVAAFFFKPPLPLFGEDLESVEEDTEGGSTGFAISAMGIRTTVFSLSMRSAGESPTAEAAAS